MNWREGWALCPQESSRMGVPVNCCCLGLGFACVCEWEGHTRVPTRKTPCPWTLPTGLWCCPLPYSPPAATSKPGPERERERAEGEDSSTWQRWKLPFWVAWSHCEADRWLHFLLLPLLKPFPLQLRTTLSFNPQHFSSHASPTAKEPELLWWISLWLVECHKTESFSKSLCVKQTVGRTHFWVDLTVWCVFTGTVSCEMRGRPSLLGVVSPTGLSGTCGVLVIHLM